MSTRSDGSTYPITNGTGHGQRHLHRVILVRWDFGVAGGSFESKSELDLSSAVMGCDVRSLQGMGRDETNE